MTQIADVLPDVLPISREKAQTAADLVQGLDSPALEWLAGFMAGAAARGRLAAPQAATPVAIATGAAVQQQLTIVYGSQTGNAKRVAEKLAAEVKSTGLPVRIVRADAYRTSDLKKEKFLYLVISTHSEGDDVEPPDDARGFYEFLMGKRAPQLPELSYSVLALGDSSYVDFCGIGRRIDERLAQLGAKRVLDRADADVDLDYVVTPWADRALQQARSLLAPQQAAAAPAPGAEVLTLRPAHSSWSRERPFLAEVLVNQRIVGSGSEKDVRHIELSLTGSGLHYQPGDALGVWPTQAPELVHRVLELLQLDGSTPVTQGKETLPLTEWLTHRRELTLVTRPFVAALAERGGHEALKALLQPERNADLSPLLNREQLVDLLRAWPAAWDAAALVAALRPLAPRMYSIASSQAQVDEEVHLTVALVQFEKEGEARWGAGSRYLSGSEEGAQVPVFIEANERFRLPADSARDVIMVGPGTGVAPFRAFVQQRQADGATGRNWLFFGNPHRHSDFLYQTEWLQAAKDGALTHLDVAFSRDQAEKVYVQQRLREHGAEVWQWLQGGAHFYVCGDAERMAGDVQRALADIAAEHGGKTPEDAAQWVKTLLLEGRYARDVY
ncbi:MAG: sulfite reductase [NADPH] flavoprotein, alpha-component [Comamonas sp. SCN 67-35]|uniref:assimilatory sulfite reductase (NADPH) flavoprotein subunit n=1 Tax=unclassified Comamonas TaxID=2638500 RepID=UPI0008688431|nr:MULTISPECIES: assimilatory sulfite reductase (NADPH) flavoprotein subunit [unclassified Comamonas]MBN9330774.1 assimilatory sulfite reductase (NADPH) flavoprotein subunit [Comamonas sp.]ODU38240.1 MAG: sulfite reductase [NADPH] flavoprotein, alpha-component [Comamonas sp. SCN 67-35]OJX03061.1 MAG: sulfite reductase [NADPH] flavoprotein, alpha-component [Burkholderiales bacterium 66-26]